MNPLDNLISEIEKLKDNHVFQFFNAQNNQKLSKGYAGKYQSQNIWDYTQDIIEKHGSIKTLLSHFKNNQGVQSLRIEFRKKNGNRSLKTDINPITVHLGSPAPTTPMQDNNQQVQPVQQPSIPQPPTPNLPLYPQQGLGAGMVPLGLPQYMDFVKKEERLNLIERENQKLEKENTELKADKRKLQLDLDEAKSKCTLADERLALEKDKIESNKRSFFESEAFKKIVDRGPEYLSAFLTSNGTAAPQAGLSGVQIEGYSQASEINKQFVAFILQANPTDEMTEQLYKIFMAVINDPTLITQINQFIPHDNNN